MTKQKVTVEVIPWLHGAHLLCHEDIIRYIRDLPKNSSLAMEISPATQVLFLDLFNILSGKRSQRIYDFITKKDKRVPFKKMTPKKVKRDMGVSGWAYLEVLHECRKKNIAVIPIETLVSYAKSEVSGTATKKEFAMSLFREKTFARQIKTTLMKFKGERLLVLTGLGHSLSLQRELTKIGVRTTLNIEIFTQRELVTKALKIDEAKSKAIAAGRKKEGLKLRKKLYAVLGKKRKEKWRFGGVKKRIIRELKAKRTKANKHVKQEIAKRRKVIK